MSSSFRRRATPKISAVVPAKSHQDEASSPSTASTSLSSLVGTKPWTGGLTLTSFGLREVDSLFLGGGGQPLRTAILLEEDRWTNDLSHSLMRYWSAEVRPTHRSLARLVYLPHFYPHILYCQIDSLIMLSLFIIFIHYSGSSTGSNFVDALFQE
jgi:hypothetical protein